MSTDEVKQSEQHRELKEKLKAFFRQTGHVAAHGVEDLAEGAVQIALAGRLGD